MCCCCFYILYSLQHPLNPRSLTCLLFIDWFVVWQTGELERWAERFRRPQHPAPQELAHLQNIPVPEPPARQGQDQQERPQEGPMAALTAGLRLAEQVLFVFVASLWPNAVGGGIPAELRDDAAAGPPPPPEPQRPDEPRRRNTQQQNQGEEENPNGNNRNDNPPRGEGENPRADINIAVQ